MNSVFVDIDTQYDFLYPTGALYVPGAERIVSRVAALNRFAFSAGIPVISTTDAHAENDVEFALWPHHCVAGTLGQRKPEATLLDRRVVVPNRDFDLAALDGARQIIVEKQTVDVFQAPNLGRIVERLPAERYIVYGVVTEICVLFAVRGLLRTGKPVTVVTDAVESLAAADSERALDEIRANGGEFLTTGEICSR
jgi:nicotinamidase/pyrazinamidase